MIVKRVIVLTWEERTEATNGDVAIGRDDFLEIGLGDEFWAVGRKWWSGVAVGHGRSPRITPALASGEWRRSEVYGCESGAEKANAGRWWMGCCRVRVTREWPNGETEARREVLISQQNFRNEKNGKGTALLFLPVNTNFRNWQCIFCLRYSN